MQWPIAMLRPFVSWTRIVQSISGWSRGSRICVVAGAQDVIVTVPIARTMAEFLRQAVRQLVSSHKLDALPSSTKREADRNGVEFLVVEKGPHHFQNDLVREDAARQVLTFLKRL